MFNRYITLLLLIFGVLGYCHFKFFNGSNELSGEKALELGSFHLKHIHHSNPNQNVHAVLDLPNIRSSFSNLQSSDNDEDDARIDLNSVFTLSTRKQLIPRLKDLLDPIQMEHYIDHRLEQPQINTDPSDDDWDWYDARVPNVSDPLTILQLAKIASNAYARIPDDPSWRDVRNRTYSNETTDSFPGFDLADDFGWLNDGIRGHIFVSDESNSTPPLVIIAIKGTSAAALGGGSSNNSTGDDGRTIDQDKMNDNLLFSCCCARVSSLWSTVCDCFENTQKCNQNCLERALRRPDKYYKATLSIYRSVKAMYPDSDVWVTGHSLGGALSSLLGRTYGLPVVTFEAPGEQLASKRLRLPSPPGLPEILEHIWHFGNNADPIFMGTCNGVSSSCSIGGYAMESQCHSGIKCTYDTVLSRGWHVSIVNHRLKTVIDELLEKEVYGWSKGRDRLGFTCARAENCVDCWDWTFVDHVGDENKQRLESSKHLGLSPTSTSRSKPTEPPKDRKCLKYTWYGKCYKWDDDDDDVDDKSSHSRGKTTLVTKTKTSSTRTSTSVDPTCIGYNWIGMCTEYGPAITEHSF